MEIGDSIQFKLKMHPKEVPNLKKKQECLTILPRKLQKSQKKDATFNSNERKTVLDDCCKQSLQLLLDPHPHIQPADFFILSAEIIALSNP